MSEKRSRGPGRREFLQRVGAMAVFTPPLMLALGSTTAHAASAYERINSSLQQANKLISETRGIKTELAEREFEALGRPIRQLKQQADSLNRWFDRGGPNGWPPRP